MRPGTDEVRSNVRNGKRLTHDSFLNLAATDATGANALADNFIAILNADALQIHFELALRDPGRFATVSAEILRLTAFFFFVSTTGLFTADAALL